MDSAAEANRQAGAILDAAIERFWKVSANTNLEAMREARAMLGIEHTPPDRWAEAVAELGRIIDDYSRDDDITTLARLRDVFTDLGGSS